MKAIKIVTLHGRWRRTMTVEVEGMTSPQELHLVIRFSLFQVLLFAWTIVRSSFSDFIEKPAISRKSSKV
jgi:hypothetical protein